MPERSDGPASAADAPSSAAKPDNASAIERVAIVGFGTMGSGIAQVCAQAGMPVVVVEASPEVIERDMAQIARQLDRAVSKGRLDAGERDATLARIGTGTSLDAARDADLVIEAITERLEAKLGLVRELDSLLAPHAIVATNTSALSVTEIAAACDRPDRVCGLHFFNPAPVLPLVEVVRAERTSDATIDAATEWVRRVGKHPIACADTPGFVVNRLLIPVLNDAVNMLDAGVASATDIDDGSRFGLNWPIGPLALADLIGLDVCVHAAEALWQAYREPRFAPPPLLVRMVKAGKLGRKSGEGFFRYDER